MMRSLGKHRRKVLEALSVLRHRRGERNVARSRDSYTNIVHISTAGIGDREYV